MNFEYKNMKIIVKDTYEEVSKIAAAFLKEQLKNKPDSVLGLATGSTPEGMYKELVSAYQSEELDFKEAKSFNLDEYYPILRTNAQSYNYYMNEHLFNHINMKAENIHIPNGEAEDVEVACREYDQKIEEEGGIDIQVLGIGHNGHIGFNEPGKCFRADTHLAELDEETVEANLRFFQSRDEVPTKAISLGMKNIMQAKKIILIANGEGKSDIMYSMLEEEINPQLPATILKLHKDVTIILDKEAAKEILERQ